MQPRVRKCCQALPHPLSPRVAYKRSTPCSLCPPCCIPICNNPSEQAQYQVNAHTHTHSHMCAVPAVHTRTTGDSLQGRVSLHVRGAQATYCSSPPGGPSIRMEVPAVLTPCNASSKLHVQPAWDTLQTGKMPGGCCLPPPPFWGSTLRLNKRKGYVQRSTDQPWVLASRTVLSMLILLQGWQRWSQVQPCQLM